MGDYPFMPSPRTGELRPLLPVTFPGLRATFIGLVDTGAAAIRIYYSLAEELGVDLTDAPADSFVAGGRKFECRIADVPMKIGRQPTRTMSVAFTDGWDQPYFLLGMRGFFETYVVKVNLPDNRLTVQQSKSASLATSTTSQR